MNGQKDGMPNTLSLLFSAKRRGYNYKSSSFESSRNIQNKGGVPGSSVSNK